MTELVSFSHVPAPSSQLHWEGIHNSAELHMQVTSASVTTKEMPSPPSIVPTGHLVCFLSGGHREEGLLQNLDL